MRRPIGNPRAVELDPRNSENHHLRHYVLQALNRYDESLEEQKLATDLDPRLRPFAMAYLLIWLHRYDDAIQDARARMEAEPADPSLLDALAQAYRLKGMDQQSAEEWAKCLAGEGQGSDADASRRAFASGGMNGLLEWQLAQDTKSSSKNYFSPYDLAKDYARLRKEDTLRLLEQAYQQHVAWMVFLQSEPDFDFVHSEPRYQAIVRGMKLPAN
jgi:tetratricopeptide (TPR) repeat protein